MMYEKDLGLRSILTSSHHDNQTSIRVQFDTISDSSSLAVTSYGMRSPDSDERMIDMAEDGDLDMQLHLSVLRNWSAPDASNYDLLQVPAIRYIVVIIHVIVIVIGAVGNGLVVVVAACSKTTRPLPAKTSQTATKVFILCLAISDLTLCIFSLPIQLHYQLTNRWYLGSALCRVVFAALAVPMYLSTVTILLIAVDRYLLVVHPFSGRLSACRAACLIVANVVVSLLLAAPVVHYTLLHVIDNDPELGIDRMQLCVERWSNADIRRMYSVCTFTVQFCVPLVLTAVLYARIYTSLRLRRHRPGRKDFTTGNSHNAIVSDRCRPKITGRTSWNWCKNYQLCRTNDAASSENGVQHQSNSDIDNTDCDPRITTTLAGETTTHQTTGSARHRRAGKTNRILAAIVINFVVCWLPWNVFGLVTELNSQLVRGRYFKLIDLSLKGFAMSSACINPLLYYWLNETLRRDLANVAVKLRLRRVPRVPGTNLPPAGPPGSSRASGRSPLPGRFVVAGATNAASPGAGRSNHLRLPARNQRGTVRIGTINDLPRFDVQPPSCCADGISGEFHGPEPYLVETGCSGSGSGRLKVSSDPWPTSSCYLSSDGSPLGTMSVTFERSSTSLNVANETSDQPRRPLTESVV